MLLLSSHKLADVEHYDILKVMTETLQWGFPYFMASGFQWHWIPPQSSCRQTAVESITTWTIGLREQHSSSSELRLPPCKPRWTDTDPVAPTVGGNTIRVRLLWLMTDPTILSPGFELRPSSETAVQTGFGQVESPCHKRWCLTDSDLHQCGEVP